MTKNSSIYVYHLEQGGLSLPDRRLLPEGSFAEVREKYRAHVTKMFTVSMGEKPEEAATKRGDGLLAEVEDRTGAKASRTRVELRDPEKNYNKIHHDGISHAKDSRARPGMS